MFPRDIVCLRNMSISTLHKGDYDDDDNNNNKYYYYYYYYFVEKSRGMLQEDAVFLRVEDQVFVDKIKCIPPLLSSTCRGTM